MPRNAGTGTNAKPEDRPLTLSDLPGGATPDTPQNELSNMTHGDISKRVNSLLDSGKGVAEILNSFGLG